MSGVEFDLPATLASIRQQAVALAAAAWPTLGDYLDATLPEPMEPFALLPICTGVACGAPVATLIPLAAVITVAAYALRVVDDCADQDDADALHLAIGVGRAVNAAVALTTVAAHSLQRAEIPTLHKDAIIAAYHHAFLQVCAGQDQDMQSATQTLPDYCAMVQAKTVAAFEFAAWAGARLATDDATRLQHCRACGNHVGWLIQMLDDIEALWFPAGSSDLDRARLTFPILYGLTLDHPARALLVQLATAAVEDRADQADNARICALLDQMQVRQHLMGHVLDHRDAAFAQLATPLVPHGRAILQLWLDWLMRDAGRMVYAHATG